MFEGLIKYLSSANFIESIIFREDIQLKRHG